jgi:hypothetical protein
VDPLESRDVPATFYWIGDVDDGNADDGRNYLGTDNQRLAWNVRPGRNDTVAIDDHQRYSMMVSSSSTYLDFGALQIASNAPDLRDPWDAPAGNLVVAGRLMIHGGSQDGGRVFLHRFIADDPNGTRGVLNIVDGIFFYNAGNFDSDDDGGSGIDRTGRVFVYSGAEFEDDATAGNIGAELFIGRDLYGNNSSGDLDENHGDGKTTFFFDATIGLSPTGVADLLSGSMTVDQSIVNNLFENYGTVYAWTFLSELYIQNHGTVKQMQDHVLTVTGTHTDADGRVPSL